MTVTIELSQNQVAALQAKAAAHGLTLEDWIRQVAAHGDIFHVDHVDLNPTQGRE